MSIWELLIIAVGLSMDAFAVAVCSGLSMPKVTIKKASVVGLYFGFFQGIMPVVGYFLAKLFAEKIIDFDHWIAFILLGIIGGKMIIESFKKEGCLDRECPMGTCTDRECPGRPDEEEVSLMPKKMIPLAVATSIDAMAVGISFALLKVNITLASSVIGIITFSLSIVGVKIGNIFGNKFKSKAELAGGIILVLMGIKIVFEHLGIIGF